MKSVRLGAGMAALAIVCSACTAGSEVEAPIDSRGEFFEQAIADARAQGASGAQLDVLEAAAERGYVDYADVVGLLPDFQGCIEDAGGAYFRGEDQRIGPDLVAPTYSVGIPGVDEDTALAVIEECERTHIDAVMAALWLQPSTVEARDEEFEAQLPGIVECLRSHGVTVDADAPLGEVQALVQDLAVDQGITCYTQSWA